jgi:hypothetical protein
MTPIESTVLAKRTKFLQCAKDAAFSCRKFAIRDFDAARRQAAATNKKSTAT